MNESETQLARLRGWAITIGISFVLAIIASIPIILWDVTWPMLVVMFIAILIANYDLFVR